MSAGQRATGNSTIPASSVSSDTCSGATTAVRGCKRTVERASCGSTSSTEADAGGPAMDRPGSEGRPMVSERDALLERLKEECGVLEIGREWWRECGCK